MCVLNHRKAYVPIVAKTYFYYNTIAENNQRMNINTPVRNNLAGVMRSVFRITAGLYRLCCEEAWI